MKDREDKIKQMDDIVREDMQRIERFNVKKKRQASHCKYNQ
jgi:hypothetical protein